MKHFYFLLFTFFALNLSFGQTTGDLSVVAFNADGGDDLGLVALADIAANSIIYISDNEANGLAFNDTNEGELTWNTGENLIQAGTIITFNDLSSGSSSVVSHGSITAGSSLNFSGSGDAVFIYTGTNPATPTVFICGAQNEANNQGVLEGSGLTEGSTFFTFTTSGSPDGGQYTGPRDNQASYSDYLAQIALTTNWTNQSSNGELMLPIITTPFTLGQPTTTITLTSPVDQTAFSPGTTSVNLEWVTTNLSGTETVDVVVNGATTNNATSPFTITTENGQTYSVTVNLIDSGSVVTTDDVSFSVSTLTQVANISALKSDVGVNGLGKYYEITGSSFVSQTNGYQNRRWIQDATNSGILIYDSEDVITTTYNIGDMITGLKGYTEEVNGVLRLVPFVDSGIIASTGNSITAQVVTISELNNDPDTYESTLVKLENVSFVDADGTATFSNGIDYNLTDGSFTIPMRTEFYGVFTGQVIPSGSIDVTGVSSEYIGTAQVYARTVSDFSLSTNSYELSNFNLIPNPTNTGFVTIKSNQMGTVQAQVFDLLGKEVINTVVNNERMDVSNLNTGVYVVKLTQNKNTTTKKLIIQ